MDQPPHDDVVAFHTENPCQIVYLHGSVDYYRDQNSVSETNHLDSGLVDKIAPHIAECPLVVVGYRGAEESVMHHLFGEIAKSPLPFKQGIYWCIRGEAELHPNVLKVADAAKSDFHLVKIEGFDELFERIEIEVSSDESAGFGANRFGPNYDPGWLDQPEERATLDDLDLGQALITSATYCERIGFAVPGSRDECVEFLKARGLLQEGADGNELPTRAAHLLFGKRTSELYPHSQTAVEYSSKKQQVFGGNLLSQADELFEYLNSQEVNSIIRVKSSRSASEHSAFPERVITEMVVNMLAHRDYSCEGYNRISVSQGDGILFENPGALSERLRRILRPDDSGNFIPVRNENDIRNETVADIFYGARKMDKAGSGLADTVKLVAEYGGEAHFRSASEDNLFVSSLLQAKQESPDVSQVALPRKDKTLWQANLLDFVGLPRFIFRLPLSEKYFGFETRIPFKRHQDSRPPTIARLGDCLVSFSDFRNWKAFSSDIGYFEHIDEKPIDWLIQSRELRPKLSDLLASHFCNYLIENFSSTGLEIDRKKKRAYFVLGDRKKLEIKYDSPSKRGNRREVVKRKNKFCENEGFRFRIEALSSEFALRIKPIYVFTNERGTKPLPPYMQGRKATSRFKFDRIEPVWQDLQFWAIFLSNGESTINLGEHPGGSLIISSKYCSVELPEQE